VKDWRELEAERRRMKPWIRGVSWLCDHSAHGMPDRPYMRTRDGSRGHQPTEASRPHVLPFSLRGSLDRSA
jgi:hypothetical protein